jgi:L-lactate utilization protein LutC
VKVALFVPCQVDPGPTKSADIEQSPVIGAPGARSCTAFLVG